MSRQKGSKFFIEYTNDAQSESGKPKSNGRNEILLKNRNEKLYHRYYYYARIICLRYENVITCLVGEFDISAFQIAKIIGENSDRLKAIADSRITRAQLKKMYGFYDWNDKTAVKEMPKKEVYTGMD